MTIRRWFWQVEGDMSPSCARCSTRAYELFVKLVDKLHQVLEESQGKRVALFFCEAEAHPLFKRHLLASAMRYIKASEAHEHAKKSLQLLQTLFIIPEQIRQDLQASDDKIQMQPTTTAVPSHCVVLEQEARNLIAFPLTDTLTFTDMVGALVVEGTTSIKWSCDFIHALWTHCFTVDMAQIEKGLNERLRLMTMLLSRLRPPHESLSAAAQSHSLARRDRVDTCSRVAPLLQLLRECKQNCCVQLSKLIFLTQCEEHAAYRGIMSLRTAPLLERLAGCSKTRLLEFVEEGVSPGVKKFEIRGDGESLEVSKKQWREWLLVSDSVEGRRDELA